MLDSKLVDYFKNKGWWLEKIPPKYAEVIKSLDVPTDSSFAQFFLQVEDGPTFIGKGPELYQICWFSLYSTYRYDLVRTHESLNLPKSYLPLDSFEGEWGFFYDRETGKVLEIELGTNGLEAINEFSDFNDFLSWYFDVSLAEQS